MRQAPVQNSHLHSSTLIQQCRITQGTSGLEVAALSATAQEASLDAVLHAGRTPAPFLQAVAVRAMLREAFIQMPHLKTILLTQSEPLTAAVPGLAGHFTPASQAPSGACHLYECSRGAVVPQLRIRVARVDDHDDLLPLVQQAALR